MYLRQRTRYNAGSTKAAYGSTDNEGNGVWSQAGYEGTTAKNENAYEEDWSGVEVRVQFAVVELRCTRC